MAILKYEDLELEFIPMKFFDWGKRQLKLSLSFQTVPIDVYS